MNKVPGDFFDKDYNQFVKISILNSMANDIGSFAQSKGALNLTDRIDLNCGAIPEGSFQQVIDPSAQKEFLQLYTNIAEYRFAFAVAETLRLNPAYMQSIVNYCYDRGKSIGHKKINTVESAYELINYCILDGMPESESKEIIEVQANEIIWEKKTDTHEVHWNKAKASIQIYYDLQTAFINGLLDGSAINYTNSDNKIFKLNLITNK